MDCVPREDLWEPIQGGGIPFGKLLAYREQPVAAQPGRLNQVVQADSTSRTRCVPSDGSSKALCRPPPSTHLHECVVDHQQAPRCQQVLVHDGVVVGLVAVLVGIKEHKVKAAGMREANSSRVLLTGGTWLRT